jgi:hypothetical protein
MPDWVASVTVHPITNFLWEIASVPPGNNSNAVLTDYEGIFRSATNPPGAFSGGAPPAAILFSSGFESL